MERSTASTFVVTTAGVTPEDVHRVAVDRARVELGRDVIDLVTRGRQVVDRAIDGERLVYGLNTGLGPLRNVRVDRQTLLGYQVRMIRAHATGVGAPLPDEEVRAIMLARVAGAARGHSGLHPAALATLVEMLNGGVHPLVPEFGSVGASDLMHMGAIALVVIGEGVARLGDEELPGREALARAGIEPYRPLPKDGLALLSANGASIGVGALAVLEVERVARLADMVGALSLETVRGNPSPFDEEVARAKPFPGQIDAAANVRELLSGSSLYEDGTQLSVQDAICLRVIPQVHGALREQAAAARRAVAIELNAADDNPYVSIERDTIISNGNFHPMVLALAFDALRTGLAHVGMISERRMQKLMAHAFADSAPQLRDELKRPWGPVLYAAAAILAELKQLAAPVTIHSPPLIDVEDHATLAPTSVFHARRAIRLLETVLSCEAMLAADALDREPELPRLGSGTQRLYDLAASILADDARGTAAGAVEELRLALVA